MTKAQKPHLTLVLTHLLALSLLLFTAKAKASLPLQSFDTNWKKAIGQEFDKPYFRDLDRYLTQERKTKTILPAEELTFAAFKLTPFEKVKIVIIGQDPYQTIDKKSGLPYGQGLAFSIRPEIKTIPPSLMNIYKKLNREFGYPIPASGDLTSWAQQGVLMINAVLTVEKDKAGSHKNKPSKNANWEVFTDSVIESIASKKQNVVFMLWGNFAKSKRSLIDKYKSNGHLIIESQHPSPLATAKPSFVDGPSVFNAANTFLKVKNKTPIDWKVEK